VVAGLPGGVAVLVPGGPALLVEVGLLGLVVPLVVLLRHFGVAVLVPGGLAGLVEEGGLDHVAAFIEAVDGAAVAIAAVVAPFCLLGEPAPLIVLFRQLGGAVLEPRGLAVLVEVGQLDLITPLVVAGGELGVAILVPGGLAV